MKPKVVRLSDDNYNYLAAQAHPGQSLDGVLTEVITRLNKYEKPVVKEPQQEYKTEEKREEVT